MLMQWRTRYAEIRGRLEDHPWIRNGLAVVVVLVLTALFPRSSILNREYPEGSIWNEDDLIAAFPFAVEHDPAVIEKAQREAERATPLSFDRVDSVSAAVKDSIVRVLWKVAVACDARLPRAGGRRTEELLRMQADSLERSDRRSGVPVHLQAVDWVYVLRLRMRDHAEHAKDPFASLQAAAFRIVDDVAKRGFIERPKSLFVQEMIAVWTDKGIEELTPVRQYLDSRDIPLYVRDRLAALYPGQLEKVNTVAAITTQQLRPNLIQNRARTQIALQAARDRVPRSDVIVKENERIVSRHERVTAVIKSKIDSYNQARIQKSGDVNGILQILGKIGHTIAILFPFVIYLVMFRRKIIASNSRLVLISILLVFEGTLAWISFSSAFSDAAKFMILVPAAAMLLAILFDSRVAYYGTVSISFLVGAIRGNDYAIILASLVAGAMSVYTVRDIKHRSQIFRSLAFIFLGYAFAIAFDGMQRSTPVEAVTTEIFYALGNAILSPVLTFGLLAFFEKSFGVTTDLTLLELSDFNHPLLRDLSSRAPGTFHHSIVMGSLAEAAAQAIGANAILARVGAYYHDIGKMLEPEYFVENQIGSSNIHDTLKPRESARRILNHVTRGMDLAREYGLPARVIEFIPAHHGTTLVSYFLEKERKERPDLTDMADFRYAGPKPQSKETAIVMLADTIEAAARAIEEPTIERIEKLIDDVVTKRLADGELDDCELTFRDITTIKRTFLTVLTGIHHSRIKYPSESEAESARKIAERTTRLLNLPPTAEALTRRIKKLDSN